MRGVVAAEGLHRGASFVDLLVGEDAVGKPKIADSIGVFCPYGVLGAYHHALHREHVALGLGGDVHDYLFLKRAGPSFGVVDYGDAAGVARRYGALGVAAGGAPAGGAHVGDGHIVSAAVDEGQLAARLAQVLIDGAEVGYGVGPAYLCRSHHGSGNHSCRQCRGSQLHCACLASGLTLPHIMRVTRLEPALVRTRISLRNGPGRPLGL